MLVRDPFRMMLLHPGMVVSNPPVALMPRVMVVVVTHHGRPPVYIRGGSAVRISRTRPISVRVRPVRGMPTEKTCLERDRPATKIIAFRAGKILLVNLLVDLLLVMFVFLIRRKEHQGCQRRRPPDRMVSRIARTRLTRICPELTQKRHAVKITSRRADNGLPRVVLQPGRLFVVWRNRPPKKTYRAAHARRFANHA